MLGTVKKAMAVAAIGMSVAFTAGYANAAPTVLNIMKDIDDEGSARDGTEGERAVRLFNVDGVDILAGAGSHTLPQGDFVDEIGDPGNLTDAWSAYRDYGEAGLGVARQIKDPNTFPIGTVGGLQATTPSDDNVQPVSTTVGEVLTVKLLGVGPQYRIDALYFRNDGHNPTFDTSTSNDGLAPTLAISTDGAGPTPNSVWAGDGTAADGTTWTSYSLATGVTDPADPDDPVIGAALGIPTGGIIMTASDTLYLAYTNQQFYLSGIAFTLLKGDFTPVPLPAGVLLLLSGLLGLGFLGRFRSKQA